QSSIKKDLGYVHGASANRAFERNFKKFLGFYRKFHRQFVEYFLSKTIDDQADGFFGVDAALIAVKYLVFSNLTGGGLVFYLSGGVFHFNIRKCVRPAFVSH